MINNKRRINFTVLLSCLIILVFAISSSAQDKADTKYWIFFKDKGKFKPTTEIKSGSEAYKEGMSLLSDKAVKRRLKVLPEDKLIDYRDLRVNADYISKIKNAGIEIIAVSRWFNGVSSYLTKSQFDKLKKLGFVSGFKAGAKLFKQSLISLSPVEAGNYYDNLLFGKNRNSSSKNILDYGKSFPQLDLIKVPSVHDMNITGKGVLIASFDDGFEWRDHEALRNGNIIAEYDFVNKDENTFGERNQKYNDTESQGGHGTATLSSIGGFKEGKLIGSAFGADFILAKTEYVATETPMEEDFWLEAAEWAEAKGADIITSSLIYKEFDKPYIENSYKYEDFNGNTAITTLAGQRAAYLGIVVVNAAGNYYQTAVPSLGSAADGDSIIAVGAVMNNGNIAIFSSNGPASNGTIKPDIVAQGVSDYVAILPSKTGNDNSYDFANGTSFSTPITAGVCALILSVHPELTPMQVRDALRNTATLSNEPNNIMGWGLINAYKAILYFGTVWSNEPTVNFVNGNADIKISAASGSLLDINSAKIFYKVNGDGNFNDEKMNLIKSNEDGNNSGQYGVTLKGIKSNDITEYYFQIKDFEGKGSVYPKDAPQGYFSLNK